MFSKSCIYGLQAVLYLAAQRSDGYVPIRQISDSLGLSYAFLTKVLQLLTRRGLLRSHRGPRGGVALAKPPDAMRLGEVVEAIDGRALFEACILGLPGCGVETPCPLHDQWMPVRGGLDALFAAASLHDLAAPSSLLTTP